MKNKTTSNRSMAAAMLLSLAAASVPAAAQQADSGLYVGGLLGRSDATDACAFGTPCGGDDTTYGMFAGWQFNRAFAVEVGYKDLGTSLSAGRSIDGSAAEAVLVGGLPLGPVLVYGKGGVYRGEASSGPAQDIGVNWTFGGGVQYDVTQRFGVRAEWQRYRQLGGSSIGFRSDVDTITGGVVFKFR